SVNRTSQGSQERNPIRRSTLSRASSLLLCTGKCNEVRLCLRKSRVRTGFYVYGRRQNALTPGGRDVLGDFDSARQRPVDGDGDGGDLVHQLDKLVGIERLRTVGEGL